MPAQLDGCHRDRRVAHLARDSRLYDRTPMHENKIRTGCPFDFSSRRIVRLVFELKPVRQSENYLSATISSTHMGTLIVARTLFFI